MLEPGQAMTPGRHNFEHAVVTRERRGLSVELPIELERDLRVLAAIGPAGGGFLGPIGRAARYATGPLFSRAEGRGGFPLERCRNCSTFL